MYDIERMWVPVRYEHIELSQRDKGVDICVMFASVQHLCTQTSVSVSFG